MASPSKLLCAYELLVAAEEEKQRLIPERLATLIADKPWVKAVSKHSQARQAFLEAAIDFCRSEKAKAQRTSRKAKQKRTVTSGSQEVHAP